MGTSDDLFRTRGGSLRPNAMASGKHPMGASGNNLLMSTQSGLPRVPTFTARRAAAPKVILYLFFIFLAFFLPKKTLPFSPSFPRDLTTLSKFLLRRYLTKKPATSTMRPTLLPMPMPT